ncbi:hypothetical protein [Demequina capsici]|uniref:Uncharacterized protein n=1 Tax=Demequina capsici TaxID=3075620 RepID=A0AA96J756_9MICO|nr:hypothetical protein [Demequina sp. OYTSA14]WNM24852.1 hypothetical protein RN606_01500 [Demequina sp. OYTSA14]
MRRFEEAFQDAVDASGAEVARALREPARVDALRSRAARERRRLTFGTVGALLLAGVVAGVVTAPGGDRPEPFQAASATVQTSELDAAVSAETPVGPEALTVGGDTHACGDEWTLDQGVVVHARQVLAIGAALIQTRTVLEDVDPEVSAAAAAGFSTWGIRWESSVRLAPGDAGAGLRLVTESFAILGGVVVGWMPAVGASSEAVDAHGIKVLQSSVPAPVPGSCGTGADSRYAAAGTVIAVVAQVQDAEGSPVATWVEMSGDALTGPTRVAGVSLACGDALPSHLPGDLWPAAVGDGGDVASAQRTRIVGRVTSLLEDQASPADGVVHADPAVVQLRLVQGEPGLDYYATAVMVDQGRIVAAVPVTVYPNASDSWEIGTRLDGAMPLRPRSCLTGVPSGGVEPQVRGAADGAGSYEVHAVVVAVDPLGRVVGHWFDPAGLPAQVVEMLVADDVPGPEWQMVESPAAAALWDAPPACGDVMVDTITGNFTDRTVRGLAVQARAFVVDDTLHVESSPTESVAGLTPLYVEVALDRLRDGVTYEVSAVTIRSGVVVGVTDVPYVVGDLGRLPSEYAQGWTIAGPVAPGVCARGAVSADVEGIAVVHLTVRALSDGEVWGAWFDPTGGGLARVDFLS